MENGEINKILHHKHVNFVIQLVKHVVKEIDLINVFHVKMEHTYIKILALSVI